MKFKKEYTTKEWIAFTKEGVGGEPVFAKTKTDAEHVARIVYGRGAFVEYRKRTKVSVFVNE